MTFYAIKNSTNEDLSFNLNFEEKSGEEIIGPKGLIGLVHAYCIKKGDIDVFVFRKNEDFDKQAYEKGKKQTMKIWTS
jgi:hypothetical protein